MVGAGVGAGALEDEPARRNGRPRQKGLRYWAAYWASMTL